MVVVRRAADGAHDRRVPAAVSRHGRSCTSTAAPRTRCAANRRCGSPTSPTSASTRSSPGTAPVPITPEPPAPRAVRFADFGLTPDGSWVIGVRERHGDGEAVNDVAAFPVERSASRSRWSTATTSSPRRGSAPMARQLAWLCWDHPEHAVGRHGALGRGPARRHDPGASARRVAGGRAESISQPRWSPDGRLHFVSDRTGWWNLYVDDGAGGRALAPRAAEFTEPDWVVRPVLVRRVGRRHAGRGVVVSRVRPPRVHPARRRCRRRADRDRQRVHRRSAGWCRSRERCSRSPARPTEGPAVVRIAIPSGDVESSSAAATVAIDPGYLSVPVADRVPHRGRPHRARAVLPRPPTRTSSVPADERPPLMVHEPRRTDERHQRRPQPGRPVLDQSGFRRRRRQLRRQHRLRTRLPRSAPRTTGASSMSTTV